jgi:hypothetical protein
MGSNSGNVTVTAGNTCGTSSASTLGVTITTTVTPSVSIAITSGTNPTCSGSSVTFTATPANGGTTPIYQWKRNGGNVGTNSSTFTSSTLTNGDIITCELTSNDPCASPLTATSNSISMTVSSTPAQPGTITGNTTVCSGSTNTYSITSVSGATGYTWTVPSGATINSGQGTTSISVTFGTSSGNVSVTADNSCGSSTARTSSITVNTAPAQPGTISGASTACSGSSQTYSISAVSGATTYTWTVPSGASINSGQGSTSINVTMGSNSGNVTVTAGNTCGTSSASTLGVTITTTVTPSVSIAITSGTNPTCSGSSVTFTATPANGGTTPSYQWKRNGGNVGTNSSTFTTSTLTNGDIITCELTSNDPCASPLTATSNSIMMTVNATVTPSVSISVSPSSTINAGDNATFTATPTNEGASPTYQWRVNGGNVGTNSNTFSSTTLANGDIVTCVLTSNAACTTTSTATSNGITMTVNTGSTCTWPTQPVCNYDTIIGTCSRAVTGRPDRITSSTARVVWGSVSSDATAYIIEFRPVGSETWQCGGTALHPATTLTLHCLEPSTTYEWRVKTQCASGGYSAWNSNTKNNFTTLAAGGNCTQPVTAPAYNITSTDATVRWSNQTNTTDYTLQYRASGSSTWTTVIVPNPGEGVSQVKRRIQGLTASTTYEWQVSGNCTDGASTNFVSGTNFTTLSGARIGQPTEEEYMAEAADKFSPARELPMVIGTYPNPVVEILNIGFSASTEQDVVITIVDMLGKQQHLQYVKTHAGHNNFTIDTEDYPVGVYMILLSSGDSVEKVKFVKQNKIVKILKKIAPLERFFLILCCRIMKIKNLIFFCVLITFHLDAQNLNFANKIGGIASDNLGDSHVDSEGNIYITGNFRGDANFNTDISNQTLLTAPGNNTDAYFAKYSSTGNLLWAKRVGGTNHDQSNAIKTDANNNVYLAILFQNTIDNGNGITVTSNGGFDILLSKYDTDGNFIWAKQIGGKSDDRVFDMAVSSSGNIYICGTFNNTVDFNPDLDENILRSVSLYDAFVAKYSTDGFYRWAFNMGGSGSDRARGITIDNNENVYVTGSFTGTADFNPGATIFNLTSGGISDVFFAKYTTNGSFVLAKNIGSSLDHSLANYKIEVDNNQNIYLAGFFRGNFDFNPNAGTHFIQSRSSTYDGFFARYNSNGSLGYVRHLFASLTADTRVNAIRINPLTNELLIGGITRGSLYFTPNDSINTKIVNDTLRTNAYLARYTTNGNFIWAHCFQSKMGNAVQDIEVQGNFVYVSGTLSDTTNFSLNGSYLLNSNGGSDAFFSKYQFETCNSPLQGTVNNITASSARLNWSLISNAQQYEIQYKPLNSISWVSVLVNGTNSSTTVSNLLSSTTYEWRIRTICESGISSWRQSSNANFTTLSSGVNCSAPTTAPAYNITSTDATVRWSNQANTSDYTLQYRVSGTTTWTNLTVLNPGTSVSQVKRRIQGLTASTTYEWQVRGNCTDGGSTNFVNGTNFTTLSGARIGQPTDEEYMAEAADKLSPARELPMIIGTYPNPVIELLNIGFNASAEQDIVITIVDMLGKQLYIEQIKTQTGKNTLKVNTENYPAGVYMILLSSGESVEKVKFVKQ